MGLSKKIIYLAGGRSVTAGNAGHKINSIIACWRRMGHQVEPVFGGDMPGGVADSRPGCEYGNVSYYRKWYRRFSLLAPLVHSFSERRDIIHHKRMQEHLRELCDTFQPDLIWERSYRLHCPGLVTAKRLAVPYVLEWKDHLVDYNFSLYRSRALAMEEHKNQDADYVIVESNVLREELARKGIDRDKIIVAHNAVDVSKFKPDEQARFETRKSLGVGRDEVLAGYLGSYAFYHDAGRLVLAADIIKKHNAHNIKIVMVGAGEEYPQARRVGEERKLLDSVLIMKPAVSPQQVPGILAALDIAVLPGSTDIICPIKIQEYMASGAAVVAPDYACIREVIDDGITGMLFEPKNERALAEKILTLAEDGELRRRLAEQALQKVRQQFTWENTWGAGLEKVLTEITRVVPQSENCLPCGLSG